MFRKMRALIIEDDSAIGEFTAIALQRLEGLEVCSVIAPDLDSAIAKLSDQKYDVALVDMRLGQHSGEDVLKFLRHHPASKNRTTPTLLMSAHLNHDIIRGMRNQVNGVLAKPFDIAQLLDKVGKLVNPTGRTRSLEY